jgi:hypothetical protein
VATLKLDTNVVAALKTLTRASAGVVEEHCLNSMAGNALLLSLLQRAPIPDTRS